MNEQERQLQEIALRYKKNLTTCMKNDEYNESKLMMHDSAYDIQEMYVNLTNDKTSKEKKEILRVNFVLSTLEKKKSNIIWNEYFFQIEKFWWMRYYSRSTFYRLRNQAIKEFFCLY